MEWKDLVNVLAVALSPLFAVQVTVWLQDRKERLKRKRRLYETLMTTRGWPGAFGSLSQDHIRALNLIDIEFHGDRRAAPILEAWRAYLAQLNSSPTGSSSEAWEAWGQRRTDLLVDLLHEMSKYLGYAFDKTNVRKDTYVPQGYGQIEEELMRIRRGALAVLEGERAIAIKPAAIAGGLETDDEAR